MSYTTLDDYQIRCEKTKELEELGVDPYPAHCTITHTIAEAQTLFAEDGTLPHFEAAATGPPTKCGGRIILKRSMGALIFLTLEQEGRRLQVMLHKKWFNLHGYTPQEKQPPPLKVAEKKLDIGDWIVVEGTLFLTQKGERTLLATQLTITCKSLLPLPDKHHGLVDTETRIRKRWLEWTTNPNAAERVRQRATIVRSIRTTLENDGYTEVETSVLQSIYGGAQARPFTTHLHALHEQLYLRIALETNLKKMVCGGLEKVFEIGRAFRNEGIDKTHNPEFTMLELYATYHDYYAMMEITERLVANACRAVHGTTLVTVDGTEIDFGKPWQRLSMDEAIARYSRLNPEKETEEQLRAYLIEQHRVDPTTLTHTPRGMLIALCFEACAEHHLIQPTHIYDHPIETTPLCKLHRDPQLRARGYVERFESFVAGKELCNAYSELNDPRLQRELLVQQAAQRSKGDEESCPMDEEFLEAIAQGMPTTGGLGIGIDRLVMLLLQAESIRDIIAFPMTRRKESTDVNP